jgi:hypothetical protein
MIVLSIGSEHLCGSEALRNNHPLLGHGDGDGEPSIVSSPSPSPSSSSISSSSPPAVEASNAPDAPPGSHSEPSSHSTTTMASTTATTLLPFPVPPPPAPIPLPEPVHVPPQPTDHAQTTTRSSSSNGSPPSTSADLHRSRDLTSSSPNEVNRLLAAHGNNNNNYNSSELAPLTIPSRRTRPQHPPASSANPPVGSRYLRFLPTFITLPLVHLAPTCSHCEPLVHCPTCCAHVPLCLLSPLNLNDMCPCLWYASHIIVR